MMLSENANTGAQALRPETADFTAANDCDFCTNSSIIS